MLERCKGKISSMGKLFCRAKAFCQRQTVYCSFCQCNGEKFACMLCSLTISYLWSGLCKTKLNERLLNWDLPLTHWKWRLTLTAKVRQLTKPINANQKYQRFHHEVGTMTIWALTQSVFCMNSRGKLNQLNNNEFFHLFTVHLMLKREVIFGIEINVSKLVCLYAQCTYTCIHTPSVSQMFGYDHNSSH